MKWLLLALFPIITWAKPLKVAIIDTGLDKKYFNKVTLCGTKDFTGTGIHDVNGHGTNVTGLIQKHAGKGDYCFMIIKAFPEMDSHYTQEALAYLAINKPDIINYSAGGNGGDPIEKEAIQFLLSQKIHINVAAGNEGTDLDKSCDYYPACYDERLNVISNMNGNQGSIVDVLIDGNKKTAFGLTQSGTSQSTAIFTGRMIKKILEKRK